MRHLVTAAVALGCALAVTSCAPVAAAGPAAPGRAAPAPAATGTWGKAEQVPGLAALAGTGDSGLNSVSCASPGNCSAGGWYVAGPSGSQQGFVVSQVHGTWGTALQVPGLAALNLGGQAQVLTVSCASPGNCTAGGYYTSGHYSGGAPMTTAFVVSQVGGSWGTAQDVPGLAALNTGLAAGVTSVSCTSPGDCSAGGSYGVPVGPACCRHNAFVVSQVRGTWGTAQRVPGSGGIISVSCSSPGNCSAAGGLVVSQVHGTWGTAREIAGTAVLTKRGSSQVTSVSCTSPGDCAAGGDAPWSHPEGSSTREFAVPFVVSQSHGTWGHAATIPGIGKLSKNGYAVVTALSCASPGNCDVAGRYSTSSYNPDGSGPDQVFLTSLANGVPQAPQEVTSALSNDGAAELASIACPAAGGCSAAGYYWRGQQERAFVISQAG